MRQARHRPPLFILHILFAAFTLLCTTTVSAQDDKAVKDQRREAHKARSAASKQRADERNAAVRELRAFAGSIEEDYRAQLRELDVQLELRLVALRAEEQNRVAEAEAYFQKEWSSALLPTAGGTPELSLERMQSLAQSHNARLFEIKKAAADERHRASLNTLAQQHALQSEMEESILAQAESLGFMAEYPPILAEPIAGELTSAEQKWNERAQRAAEKISERHRKLLASYRNGPQIRDWERTILEEDFVLHWAEQEELRTLNADQILINTMMIGSSQNPAENSQSLMEKMAQLNEAQQKIRIRYQQIHEENRIKRRETRKILSSQ